MDRIPVGARFYAPVQTGPGAHPASYTMGTGSFTGVKRPGHAVHHPPTFSAEVKKRVELYLFSVCGSSWPVLRWTVPLPLCVPILQCGKNCKLCWNQDYSWCCWSPRNSSLRPHALSYQWIWNSVSSAVCINSTLWSPITRLGMWWTFIHIHFQIRPKYLCRSLTDTGARIITMNGRQRTAMCNVVTQYCGCDNSCVVASIMVWELDHFRSFVFVAHRQNTKSTHKKRLQWPKRFKLYLKKKTKPYFCVSFMFVFKLVSHTKGNKWELRWTVGH